jgi:hypothetical protein
LALLTPADVHSGQAGEKLQQRQAILHQAYYYSARLKNGGSDSLKQ